MKNNINSVIWARVCCEKQASKGQSLKSQEKTLCEYADKKSFHKTKIFSAVEGASEKSKRETFREMLKFIKLNGVNIVICEKVETITRNFKDMALLDDWLKENSSHQIHLVDKKTILHKNSNTRARLIWDMEILFARYYHSALYESRA